MKFEKDVFISYAHLDDKPLDQTANGWVSDFHHLLKIRLEQTVGADMNIWRDEQLAGNEIFAPEIEAQLPKLKVMVSIITPRYVQSDWCQKELNYFYKAANENGGIAIGNKSRIFKIIKTPVDQDAIQKLPDSLQRIFTDILDYKFYRWESDGRFKELSSSGRPEIRQEYMDKVDDVAQDIANLIKKLNSGTSVEADKGKIFVAETTYDLQNYRDNLIRELKEAGFAVLPNKNLPTVADRFGQEVEACLAECILSVHLISPTNYAVQPEGADKSIVILQNETAAAKSAKDNFSRLIWIPPSSPAMSTNERLVALQKEFVEALRRDPALQRGADILEGPLEELKLAVFDTVKRIEFEEKAKKEAEEKAKKDAEEKALKLASAPVNSAAQANAPSGGPRTVYLICDPRDLSETQALENLIFDNGHDVLLPTFDGDQKQLTEEHKANLTICDAVIIYYGAGNFRWAGSMRNDLLRLPALSNKKLLASAVYIAPPIDAEKENFRANNLEIIRGGEEFSSGLFDGFFQKLK